MVEGDEVDLKAREVRGVVNELMCITVVICTGFGGILGDAKAVGWSVEIFQCL